MKTYIGLDNGVTGSVGIITPDDYYFYPTPVFKEQSYTKKMANISRINTEKLREILQPYADGNAFVLLERPMVNPKRWKASVSALRALEATLIVIEQLGFSLQYEDSKNWQKLLLPQGIKGSPELKKASLDIGSRLFPKYRDIFLKHKDADGILLAEYGKRMGF